MKPWLITGAIILAVVAITALAMWERRKVK